MAAATAPKDLFRAHGGATPIFSLNGVRTWARVVGIYDGDTVTCVLPVLDRFYRFQVRLAGIDTCEMRSKSAANREKATAARDRLIGLVTGSAGGAGGGGGAGSGAGAAGSKKDVTARLEAEVYLVWVHCQEFDKYGRLLGALYASDGPEEPSFADILVREGLAYRYQGDTKLTEEEQLRVLAAAAAAAGPKPGPGVAPGT